MRSRRARRESRRCSTAGLRRGDVVLTLLGNRVEWVLTMVACFRQGYVALPCNEQLRAKDLRARARGRRARAGRRRPAQRGGRCARRARATSSGRRTSSGRIRAAGAAIRPVPPAVELASADPCLITFTTGTAGRAEGRRSTASATCAGQTPAGRALARRRGRGDLVWCTAASGWSKSARNVVHRTVAARRRGAPARRAASTRASALRSSSARASTSSAWRRRSTA